MTRCSLCSRIIWPWQHRGWIVGVARWHARCYRAFLADLDEDIRQATDERDVA
jgi:hypothetical protein